MTPLEQAARELADAQMLLLDVSDALHRARAVVFALEKLHARYLHELNDANGAYRAAERKAR